MESFPASNGSRNKVENNISPADLQSSERTIQTSEDLFWFCIIDWGGNWEQHFSLVEFTCNNSYEASIR